MILIWRWWIRSGNHVKGNPEEGVKGSSTLVLTPTYNFNLSWPLKLLDRGRHTCIKCYAEHANSKFRHTSLAGKIQSL